MVPCTLSVHALRTVAQLFIKDGRDMKSQFYPQIEYHLLRVGSATSLAGALHSRLWLGIYILWCRAQNPLNATDRTGVRDVERWILERFTSFGPSEAYAPIYA